MGESERGRERKRVLDEIAGHPQGNLFRVSGRCRRDVQLLVRVQYGLLFAHMRRSRKEYDK